MPPFVPPLPGNSTNDPNFWATWRSTYYAEKEGSPEGSLYFDRGQLIRHIYVGWAGLDQAVLDFCGTISIIDNGVGRAISRTPPHAYPKRPYMYVQGVGSINPQVMVMRNPTNPLTLADVQGRDTDDTLLHSFAEISLQYVMPTFKVKDDDTIRNHDDLAVMGGLPDEGNALASGYTNSRYITRVIKPLTRMLTVPRGLLRTSDGKLVLEAVGINEHVAEYHYTWHQVPEAALPQAQWILGANTVNDTVFDGRPVGTLLFTGEPELRLNPSPLTGQILYDVTYRFHSLLIPDASVTPAVFRGWNYIRKPTTGGLTPLIYSITGALVPLEKDLMFRNFDFRRLFNPDPFLP